MASTIAPSPPLSPSCASISSVWGSSSYIHPLIPFDVDDDDGDDEEEEEERAAPSPSSSASSASSSSTPSHSSSSSITNPPALQSIPLSSPSFSSLRLSTEGTAAVSTSDCMR